MNEFPINFCVHLALAIFKGQKVVTYKPLSVLELKLQAAGQPVPSPYGQPGDVLWVREPFGTVNGQIVYQAIYARDGYRARVALPNGFVAANVAMTQNQARMLLTVQSVDVVDLQVVDEAAAKAAGTIPTADRKTYLDEFKVQWNDIYKTRGWDTNPPCWRVAFTLNQ